MNMINVFIDNSNLFNGVRRMCGEDFRLDYLSLKGAIELLLNKDLGMHNLYRHNIYVSERKTGETNQDLFFKKLQYLGYVVHITQLKEYESGKYSECGNVDVAIATDMMKLISFSHVVKIAVLVSGDGGFSYLSEELRKRGVYVILVAVEHGVSESLMRSVDRFIILDKDKLQTMMLHKEHMEDFAHEKDKA